MRAHEKTKFFESGEELLSSIEESNDEFDPNYCDSDDNAKKRGFLAKKVPPKSKTPAGRGRGETLKTQMALTANMSEYEKIRQRNIAEREEMLQELIADFDSFKKDSGIGAAKKAPLNKRNRVENDSDDEVQGSRKSVRIPGEKLVEGLARSVQAPPPGKRVNMSRGTSSGPTVNPPRCRLI